MADSLEPLATQVETPAPAHSQDARCSGLYFALAKLSETGETGNQASYRETAAIFLGISVTRLIEAQGLSQSDAEISVVEDVKRYRDQYWQRLVYAGKSGQYDDAVLDSDIPFCLNRGELYAQGKL